MTHFPKPRGKNLIQDAFNKSLQGRLPKANTADEKRKMISETNPLFYALMSHNKGKV
jgi:hypothetical protein